MLKHLILYPKYELRTTQIQVTCLNLLCLDCLLLMTTGCTCVPSVEQNSRTRYLAVNGSVREIVKKWPWPNLRCCLCICPGKWEGLKKNTKNITQEIRLASSPLVQPGRTKQSTCTTRPSHAPPVSRFLYSTYFVRRSDLKVPLRL